MSQPSLHQYVFTNTLHAALLSVTTWLLAYATTTSDALASLSAL